MEIRFQFRSIDFVGSPRHADESEGERIYLCFNGNVVTAGSPNSFNGGNKHDVGPIAFIYSKLSII